MAILTHSHSSNMRVDLKKFNDDSTHTVYSDFKIDAARWRYKLHYSEHLGDGRDSLNLHNGAEFSAKNSGTFSGTAVRFGGGWWYSGDGRESNLNGIYYDTKVTNENGIFWFYWESRYVLKECKMMIRPNGKGECAFVFSQSFSMFPRVGKPGKMFPQQCFQVCPRFKCCFVTFAI